MHLTLEIRTGDDAGRRYPVGPGPGVRVGRQAGCDIRLAADPHVSADHFRIDCDDQGSRLTDLGSRYGTHVNGTPVTAVGLANGDEIRAGQTVFAVILTGGPAPADPPTLAAGPAADPGQAADVPAAWAGGITAYLGRLPDPLYGLLDPVAAASVANRAAVEWLAGGAGLVRLPVGSPVLAALAAGWGRGWGVYLTSPRPAEAVRAHLQSRTVVKLPDGRRLPFRLYDPKVLRTHLPTLTAAEVAAFVGPVSRFVVEAAEPGVVLEFTASYRDWRRLTPGG